jgi:hypothetical protein
MKVSQMALVLGSALALAGGALVGSACSSSSSGSGSGSGGGSGSGSGGGSDASMDSSSTGDTGMEEDTGTSSGGGDAGVDCGSIPALHANTAGDIYCGYGTDGGDIDCLTGTMCCLGGSIGGNQYDPQVCNPWNAAGAGCNNPDGGGIGIACNQVSDCNANSDAGFASCCLQGAMESMVAGCGYPKAKEGTAIACESAAMCQQGETPICSSQADCPSGTTCTAGKWKIYQIGFCL